MYYEQFVKDYILPYSKELIDKNYQPKTLFWCDEEITEKISKIFRKEYTNEEVELIYLQHSENLDVLYAISLSSYVNDNLFHLMLKNDAGRRALTCCCELNENQIETLYNMISTDNFLYMLLSKEYATYVNPKVVDYFARKHHENVKKLIDNEKPYYLLPLQYMDKFSVSSFIINTDSFTEKEVSFLANNRNVDIDLMGRLFENDCDFFLLDTSRNYPDDMFKKLYSSMVDIYLESIHTTYTDKKLDKILHNFETLMSNHYLPESCQMDFLMQSLDKSVKEPRFESTVALQNLLQNTRNTSVLQYASTHIRNQNEMMRKYVFLNPYVPFHDINREISRLIDEYKKSPNSLFTRKFYIRTIVDYINNTYLSETQAKKILELNNSLFTTNILRNASTQYRCILSYNTTKKYFDSEDKWQQFYAHFGSYLKDVMPSITRVEVFSSFLCYLHSEYIRKTENFENLDVKISGLQKDFETASVENLSRIAQWVQSANKDEQFVDVLLIATQYASEKSSLDLKDITEKFITAFKYYNENNLISHLKNYKGKTDIELQLMLYDIGNKSKREVYTGFDRIDVLKTTYPYIQDIDNIYEEMKLREQERKKETEKDSFCTEH